MSVARSFGHPYLIQIQSSIFEKFGEISKTQQREQLEVSLESEHKLQNNNKMLLHFTNDTSSVVTVQKHVIDSDPEENGGDNKGSLQKKKPKKF